MKSQMKMRLLHFHTLRRIRFVLLLFLSESIAINDQSPDQGNTKNDQQYAIDAVNDMDIMRCKPVPDLPGQENFQYISAQHPGQAGNKNDYPFVHRMVDDRC